MMHQADFSRHLPRKKVQRSVASRGSTEWASSRGAQFIPELRQTSRASATQKSPRSASSRSWINGLKTSDFQRKGDARKRATTSSALRGARPRELASSLRMGHSAFRLPGANSKEVQLIPIKSTT